MTNKEINEYLVGRLTKYKIPRPSKMAKAIIKNLPDIEINQMILDTAIQGKLESLSNDEKNAIMVKDKFWKIRKVHTPENPKPQPPAFWLAGLSDYLKPLEFHSVSDEDAKYIKEN